MVFFCHVSDKKRKEFAQVSKKADIKQGKNTLQYSVWLTGIFHKLYVETQNNKTTPTSRLMISLCSSVCCSLCRKCDLQKHSSKMCDLVEMCF